MHSDYTALEKGLSAEYTEAPKHGGVARNVTNCIALAVGGTLLYVCTYYATDVFNLTINEAARMNKTQRSAYGVFYVLCASVIIRHFWKDHGGYGYGLILWCYAAFGGCIWLPVAGMLAANAVQSKS